MPPKAPTTVQTPVPSEQGASQLFPSKLLEKSFRQLRGQSGAEFGHDWHRSRDQCIPGRTDGHVTDGRRAYQGGNASGCRVYYDFIWFAMGWYDWFTMVHYGWDRSRDRVDGPASEGRGRRAGNLALFLLSLLH